MTPAVRIFFIADFCLVETKFKKLAAMPMPAHIYILANAVENNKNANCCKHDERGESVKTDMHDVPPTPSYCWSLDQLDYSISHNMPNDYFPENLINLDLRDF